MTIENVTKVTQVAILVLDTPIPNISETHGDFGDNTQDLLVNYTNYTLAKYYLAGSNVEQLQQTYRDLEIGLREGYIAGLVLTGSRSDAFGPEPWIKLLDEFISNVVFPLDVAVVGICFGHQILCKNLGAKIGRNEIGWEVGTTEINLNTNLVKLFGASSLNLVEFHQDIVYELPRDCVSIGSSDLCDIQGILSTNGKILTFQGHPEFTTTIALDLLLYKYQHGLLTTDQYEIAKHKTESTTNQGKLIGEIIAKFLVKKTI
ncbi:hypothetical protein JA1_000886 [Spathaspora sp. JA1]|nr:hypothetical protein JA1_000886 [Spathaspora sp. JA1]